MESMMHIGAEQKVVETVGKMILEILKNSSHNDQATIYKALEVLESGSSVSGTTVSTCNFTNTEK